MKKIFLFLVLILFVNFTFAITNITEDDLDGILEEVNQEIKNEITIITPDQLKQETQTCDENIQKQCEDSSKSEIELAVSKLNDFGATKFSTPDGFMTDKNIRRDEAAKMFLKFAEGAKLLPKKNPDFSCKFNDLDKARPDIVNMIGDVCKYGLFKGSNGKFMPLSNITNGQAVVVLIRLIDGPKEEIKGVGHYAENYIRKADELGLLKNLGIKDPSTWDQPATRGLVAKLLYRSLNINK